MRRVEAAIRARNRAIRADRTYGATAVYAMERPRFLRQRPVGEDNTIVQDEPRRARSHIHVEHDCRAGRIWCLAMANEQLVVSSRCFVPFTPPSADR